MFFRYNKWAMLWALLILFLCAIPGRDIPHVSFLEMLSFDKFVHAAIFFILLLLTVRGFVLQKEFHFLQRYPKRIALVVCIIYGGLLEVMQGSVFEDRSADVYDFIANSFGGMLGALLYDTCERKFLNRLIK